MEKLYIGCALTQAPKDFQREVEGFKDTLRGRGYEVFDFVGLENGSPEDVYRWDIGHCVRDCGAFVAICDYPSIGLGWELGEATRLCKPVLALAREQVSVTRLLLGAAAVEANVRLERYISLGDMVSVVDELVAARQLK